MMKSRRQPRCPGARGDTADAGFTLLELLTVLALIAVLALLIRGAANTVGQGARATSCLSNLRQLQTASLAYAYDRGGILPDSKNWQANAAYPGSLAPYLHLSNDAAVRSSPSVLTCTASQRMYKSARDYCRTYSINIYAAGSIDGVVKPYQLGRLQRSRRSSSQALYMDGPASVAGGLGYYQTSASPSNISGLAPFVHPHRGSMNVVFVDGHAETLSKHQIDTILPDATHPFWLGDH